MEVRNRRINRASLQPSYQEQSFVKKDYIVLGKPAYIVIILLIQFGEVTRCINIVMIMIALIADNLYNFMVSILLLMNVK